MDNWNKIIETLPDPHVLQTWEWGQFKARYGWQPFPKTWQDEDGRVIAAALVLQRSLGVGGLRVMYVPKGPLLDWSNVSLRQRVLGDLHTFAKKQGAIFIKIDPDVCLGTGVPDSSGSLELNEEGERAVENEVGYTVEQELQVRGWHFSTDQIQFRNTVLVDVTPSEEEMLARMKQKARYNIRLSARKGVSVRQGEISDLPMIYHMYAETSVRDGFLIRNESYYMVLWESFMRAGMVTPLIAEVEGEAVASIIVFHFSKRAYYLHGMSRNLHREKMPNYLLQWEAMRLAKTLGCTTYDLWGAPDSFVESDSMWGVYLFKRGLGGYVQRTLGAYDLPVRPFIYRLYTQTLPRILDLMRRRGKERTRQVVT